MILDFAYIRHSCITGDLKTDVVNLLNENNKNKTAAHCIDVAETCSKLAKRFDLNEEIAYMSGLLHDVSAVIKPDDMLKYAENHE